MWNCVARFGYAAHDLLFPERGGGRQRWWWWWWWQWRRWQRRGWWRKSRRAHISLPWDAHSPSPPNRSMSRDSSGAYRLCRLPLILPIGKPFRMIFRKPSRLLYIYLLHLFVHVQYRTQIYCICLCSIWYNSSKPYLLSCTLISVHKIFSFYSTIYFYIM